MIEEPLTEIDALKAAMLKRIQSPKNGKIRISNCDTGLIQLGYNDARMVGNSDVIAWAKGYCAFFEEAEIQILPHEILGCYFNNSDAFQHIGIIRKDSAITGHFSVDYELMLKVGIPGGLKYIEDWRNKVLSTSTTTTTVTTNNLIPNPRSADFYKACTIVWTGFGQFLKRYQEAAERRLKSIEISQEEGITEDRKWVARMADSMKRLQLELPHDLYDAITLITLYHMVLELSVGCCSFGQPDRFLFPYYLQSLKDGATRSDIKTLISAWFIKLNEFMDIPQGFMIGGQNAQGESMANDLTLILLEVAGELNLINPAMSFAWNPKVPARFMDQIMKNYARGVMHPQIFNDLVIIPGFERIGVTHVDAVHYVNCTCTEPTTTGCSNIFVVTEYVNPNRDLLKVIHGGNFQAVHDALDTKKGKLTSYQLQFVPEFLTFDEFLDAFFEELAFEIDRIAKAQIRHQQARIESFAQPFVSIFMHDCLETGLDMAWGGGRYNYSYPQLTGFSTLIDSLYAIKELVFSSKTHTLGQIGEILASNWKNDEVLRQKIINKLPKWGNNSKDIDLLGLYVSQKYAQIVEQDKGIFQNGGFYPGYLNYIMHGVYGKELGATPNGRFQQMSLSNSFAPAGGAGKEGFTAICNSASKIDQKRAIGSSTLNLTLLQSSLQSSEQREKFTHLIQTYFLQGGTHVQVNIFDPAMLRDAQKHPEQYPELVVKVGGFSARFVDLDSVIQDEIIARNQFSV
jgi:pyruvate-formate lyase